MNTPQRILITGSCGFVGRHVIRAARESWPDAALFGLGRTEARNHRLDAYLPVDVNVENLDVLQGYIAANRPEAVVNCLGSLSADHDTAMRGNVRTTEALIRAVSDVALGTRLVHLGSAAEYAPLEPPTRTSELAPTEPVGVYGTSKLLATRLVLEASEEGLISGMVLRLSNPLGPRMAPATLPGKVYDFVRDSGEEHLTLGNLAPYRDFVDAREVADAVTLALLRLPSVSGEVINVGSGVARRVRDLVHGMLQFSASSVTLREASESSPRSGVVGWQEMDVSKARKLLGWSTRVPWSETLRYAVHGED